LRSLGFKVKQINPIWCEVTWPEEEGVLEKPREGTWQKDMERYDYVCSACGKHAEYVSDYCPNCGKKMATLLDGNRY
jgi:Zn finger protein HypA/HybF involved in hydrogenase expression